MDVTVLTLASAGTALTIGGLISGTVDVAQRIGTYRREIATVPQTRIRTQRDSNSGSGVDVDASGQLAQAVNVQRQTEQTIAKAAGLTSNLRRLWISAAVALAGVALTGTADVVAAIHAN